MADAYEPNNTLETATPGLLNAIGGWTDASVVLADANIHSINTGDYYKFDVSQPGTVTVSLSNLASNYGVALYGYNPASSSWKQLSATTASGLVGKSLASPLVPGNYAIRVVAGTGAKASPTPYRLTLEWDGPQDKYEPNNDKENPAVGIFPAIGGTSNASKTIADATIHTTSTPDYYKLEIRRMGTLAATLDSLPSDYRLYLWIYDKANSTWKVSASDTTAGTSAKSFNKTLTEVGTYLIQVAPAAGSAASPTPYRLKLDWTAKAAMTVDCELLTCGHNGNGQLGDGTKTAHHTPVQLWIDGVATASEGSLHTMIIKTDGSLWACGYNGNGQLGDGTRTDRIIPIQIMDGNAAAVSAGENHTMIVKADGSLWACGFNGFGQLGNGMKTDQISPVQIMASNVAAASAGSQHSMIVKTDGSLWACGNNIKGQLGDGTLTERTRPVQVMASNVAAVSVGYKHSMIMKTDGSLWACGFNDYGQLGDGTTTSRTTPVQIMTGGVKLVAAGSGHTMILKTDGSLWACGQNSFGQLGDGTTTNRVTPVQVMANGVTAVCAGNSHSMIIKTDGSLWACGFNAYGQLGDGTTMNRSTPVQIMRGRVVTAAVGYWHSLILADPLAITPASWVVPAAGGVKTAMITVTDNTQWIAFSDQPWLTLDKGSGSGSGSISLTASANDTTASRTATVTFMVGAVSKTVKVTQATLVDAYEPNNMLDMATPDLFPKIGRLGDATDILNDATIHNTATPDHYKFDVTVQGTLTATLDNLPSDYRLYLYTYNPATSTWTAIASAATAGTDAKSFTKNLVAGTYAFKVVAGVGAVASATPYRLTAAWAFTRTVSAMPASWTAPKGGGSQEIQVASNSSWTAVPGSTWLKLDKVAGNGNGTLLLTAMQNETTATRTSKVTLTSGTTVKSLYVTQPSMADRYEPNNSFETATAGLFPEIGGWFDSTKSVSDANIHSINTSDYYKFEVTQPGTLTASLDNLASNYGAYLYRYDATTSSWTLLKTTTVAGAVPKNLSKPLTTGYYTVRVIAGSGAVASATPYKLTLSWDGPGPQDRYEPNNYKDSPAIGIFPGIGGLTSSTKTIADATIHTINTPDYYKLDIIKPGTLAATLDNLPSDYRLYLWFYDTTTATWKVSVSATVAGTGTKSLSKAVTVAGTYLVQVAPAAGSVASATPYRLKLDWTVAAAEVIPESVLEVSASTESITPEGGSIDLELLASGPWTIVADNVRVVASQASGMGPTKVSLVVGPRPGGASEELVLTVKSGTLVRTIKIIQ